MNSAMSKDRFNSSILIKHCKNPTFISYNANSKNFAAKLLRKLKSDVDINVRSPAQYFSMLPIVKFTQKSTGKRSRSKKSCDFACSDPRLTTQFSNIEKNLPKNTKSQWTSTLKLLKFNEFEGSVRNLNYWTAASTPIPTRKAINYLEKRHK